MTVKRASSLTNTLMLADDVAPLLLSSAASNKTPVSRGQVHKKFKEMVEPMDKQASLNRALGTLWEVYGEGKELEKHAAASYYAYGRRKHQADVQALGQPFCKLAAAMKKDPWDLAKDVIRNYPTFEKASTSQEHNIQELSQFYLDWAAGVEKHALSLAPIKAAVGGIARGAKGLMSKAKGLLPKAVPHVDSAFPSLPSALEKIPDKKGLIQAAAQEAAPVAGKGEGLMSKIKGVFAKKPVDPAFPKVPSALEKMPHGPVAGAGSPAQGAVSKTIDMAAPMANPGISSGAPAQQAAPQAGGMWNKAKPYAIGAGVLGGGAALGAGGYKLMKRNEQGMPVPEQY